MKNAWLFIDAFEKIYLEAERKKPLETGGLLIGYFSADDDQVVITDVVGPGPKAKHRKKIYKPDYTFHREELCKIFHESGGMHTYLGDWHSHPNNPAYLSFFDKRALRNIALFPDNYVDRPIMLILGGNGSEETTEWKPVVWRLSHLTRGLFWAKCEYVSLEVTVFTEF